MPTPLSTPTSTPRLSNAARHVVIPKGIVTTAWPRVVAQCEDMGVTFDPWQHGIGQIALGKRKDGKYAASVGGVVLSIGRQVGKTFWVGMVVIALCVLFPGHTVLWTAHRTRTATKTFKSLQAMVRRKKIWPHIAAIRTANGEQEILFTNGSIIMFGAREQGFGRGFDEVDVEVFDEAQILTEKALEDIIPAANQSRHPAGALLFFMGTPPRPVDPGEEFTNRRAKAIAGKTDSMVYVEFSADPNADLDDRAQWRKANPSFPLRTPLESMLRMRENLTDDDSFRREALGIWDAVGLTSVIDHATWMTRADEKSVAVDRLALAVEVAPDRSLASVAMAGQRGDEAWHIELVEQRNGTGWVVPYVVDLCKRNTIRAVVLAEGTPAASLEDEFKAQKLTPMMVTRGDTAKACGALYDAVDQGVLFHIDQPQLNSSLSMAKKRVTEGSAWVWDRKGAAGDITPIASATLALRGAQADKVKKPMRRHQGEPVFV